jgi:hypothetical protein
MTIYIISGAVAMGYAAISLFFIRFWWETRDRLFALFAVAFFVLSASRILLSILQDLGEEQILAYAIRLAAFLVFLAAIVDKNLRRS